ncbi:MAG: TetR/AcrR family transcriptional regulator [Deltaproteobacteria bacterium]|nr:TetR/AcrR family transcriptional regulator [Deltaproteobacteria bacterium]
MALPAHPSSPPSVQPLRWVKPPQQRRSQATLERLLDAAEELIRETGVGSLTVSEVARRAGSSVGAFYARFADKDALLGTLHERSCVEALATADMALDPARWTRAELGVVVHELVRFVVALCEERRRLLLAFISLAAADPGFAARRALLEESIAERMALLLHARPSEIDHPDVDLAARVSMRIILGAAEYGALLGAPGDSRSPSGADLARELTRAVLAYLGEPARSARAAAR